MPINKRIILLAGLILCNISLFSQHSVNSPYSRYGIGEIDRSGFGQNRALGGITVGMRETNQINYQNPASYNSQDTMSFIWDFGMLTDYSKSKTSSSSSKHYSLNFDHIAMSFPIFKWYYASVGLVPFSNVGYNIKETYTTGDSTIYKGSGSINQLYFGNSFGLLNKKINVGFNLSYLFGSLNQDNSILFKDGVSSVIERRYVAKGLYFNVGAQGSFNITSKIKFNGGIIYDPQTKIKLDYTDNIMRSVLFINSSGNIAQMNDTINADTTSGNFVLPARLGIGTTVQFGDQLLLGFDYVLQDWSNATFLGKNDNLGTSNKFSIGAQFIPNRQSYRSYFYKINYRAGAYYNNTYLTLNGNNIKDYGFTLGLGLPFKNTNTMFHVSADFGRRGTTSNNLVEIDYSRINFSITLYDFWFIKRKYD